MNTLIVLVSLGVIALLSELLNFKKVLFPITCAGLVVATGLSMYDWNSNAYVYNRMLYIDNFAIVMTSLICGLSVLWFCFSKKYLERDTYTTDKFALILFALTGAAVMVSYNNFCMLFLGVEILSLSMYILAGSDKKSLAGNEAALKYFIIGSFATGFLLLGIALIYGVTGTFHLDTMMMYIQAHQTDLPQLFKVGILLILVAMAFKASVVPFHYWAPDVYTGSPTLVTAFMATVVKTVAIVALFRLFVIGFGDAYDVWLTPVIIMSMLTMLVGNLIATYQNQVKRMLAYSSIAHAGYLLIAIVAMNQYSTGAVFYYTMTYSIASLLAFGIVYLLKDNIESVGVEEFNGLSKRSPFLAFGMTVAMLSLAGIPPIAGFFAKYFLFSAALKEEYYALVIVAIIASLIGIYYYFKVIIAIYFKESKEAQVAEVNTTNKALIGLCIILLIGLSVIPEVFLRLRF